VFGRRLVIVHQDQGPTIEGVRGGNVLAEIVRNEIRLRQARMIEAEDRTVPLDGVVSIPRERVVFCQLVARSG
jgi:hypothetical protein